MITKPDYFDAICSGASRRWEQLEQDPDLAGPWYQLFKQVQSPRHVLSELLQNADDAGATEATVAITESEFVFSHNGEDFLPEHFASLCRFGYSNKRSLHTIGFRGIGFKSTFSIGSSVRLFTPSLAVAFDKKRFTEPFWVERDLDEDGRTHICVQIEDKFRQQELEKNLNEWLESPASLLFFKSIRSLRVKEQEVRWIHQGTGPVTDSEWVALSSALDKPCLLLRSSEDEFPADALEEIRQERMVTSEDETAFPPCRVELVLGMEGRLFVVLPTGVKTTLPFACNAPFVQDPARVKIKDPDISPTNRWLLERAGKLAAGAMLGWLEQTELSLEECSRAYELMPEKSSSSGSALEGSAEQIVIDAFAEGIRDQYLLITSTNTLTQADGSIIIPNIICDIWTAEQAAEFLDDEARSALSRHVSASSRRKLKEWGLIEELGRNDLMRVLQDTQMPRPQTWQQLLRLWIYIAPDIPTQLTHYTGSRDAHIFPVQGKNTLYAAHQIVRLAENRSMFSDDDWHFLSAHLLVLDQSWIGYLANQRKNLQERAEKNPGVLRETDTAYDILRKFELGSASEFAKVVQYVVEEFFKQKDIALADCVRLTQIAAKSGANVDALFRYFTRDGSLRCQYTGILHDQEGVLEELLPTRYLDSHLIHPSYTANFISCSPKEWRDWVESGKAKLLLFPQLSCLQREFRHHSDFEEQMYSISAQWKRLSYPYRNRRSYSSQRYYIEDYDFPEEITDKWTKHPEGQQSYRTILRLLLATDPSHWDGKLFVVAQQTSTNGQSRAPVPSSHMIDAAWLRRLKGSEFLPDTRGLYRKPGDLLRRTAQTEALIDVEAFIAYELDTPANRPLLDMLGVGSTPTSPTRLLERLAALSQTPAPPIAEVEKFYRRLDQLIDNISTLDLQTVKDAFRTQKIIYTDQNTWENTSTVFLSVGDEKLPGITTIRPSVADLALWGKVGVADRPTKERIIRSIKTFESSAHLSADDARWVRAVLPRFSVQIWEECQHWLSLSGDWTPVAKLKYTLTLQSLIAWQHLHPWVKRQTADLQSIPTSITQQPPFSVLPSLASRIEEHLQMTGMDTGHAPPMPWLTALGNELCRIQLEKEEETSRIRELAQQLAHTLWREGTDVESVPYVDGVPAGTPRRIDVVWSNRNVYVGNLTMAKLAKRVPEEIGKAFARPDIKAALDYSFNRTPADVRAYIQENFKLAAEAPQLNDTEHEAEVSGLNRLNDGNGLSGLVESGMRVGNVTDEPELEDDEDVEGPVISGTTTSRGKKSPSILARFAYNNGFVNLNGSGFYTHIDGRRLLRSPHDRTLWELYSPSGELLRSYITKEYCIERGPLPIDVDKWMLLESNANHYALILLDKEDRPIEMTGAELLLLRDKGLLNIHPATYRLEYLRDHRS